MQMLGDVVVQSRLEMFGGIPTKRTGQRFQHLPFAHFRERAKPRRRECDIMLFFHVEFPIFQTFKNKALICLWFRGTIVTYPTSDTMLTAHVFEKLIRCKVHLVGSFAIIVDTHVRKYILSYMSPA